MPKRTFFAPLASGDGFMVVQTQGYAAECQTFIELLESFTRRFGGIYSDVQFGIVRHGNRFKNHLYFQVIIRNKPDRMTEDWSFYDCGDETGIWKQIEA